MCECVMWNLYTKPSEAYFSGKKITSKKLNEVIIPETNNDKILVVPSQRNSDYYESIQLKSKKYTYKELFTILFNFYNMEPISIEKLKKMPRDTWGYIND